MDEYSIDIEIDADTGNVLWIKDGVARDYSVEELEGKGLIKRLLHKDGVEVTVYSQGEIYTYDEYKEIMGDDDI